MWLLAVAQWVDIRVAARQQDSVQTFDDRVGVIGVWNQADVKRSPAGRFDCLAVVTAKLESIGGVFNAHHDTDAWSCVHNLLTAASLLAATL
jgi:hypothetical protein